MAARILIGGQVVTGPDHFDQLVKDGLKKWHENHRPEPIDAISDGRGGAFVLVYPATDKRTTKRG